MRNERRAAAARRALLDALILVLTFLSLSTALAAAEPPATAAVADHLLTFRRDADEFVNPNGRTTGGKNQKVTVWIGADRVRRDDGRGAAILRLDLGRLCLIDHESKTYTMLEVGKETGGYAVKTRYRAFEPPKELQELSRQESAVTASDATRKVGSWNASLHKVSVTNKMSGGSDFEWWTSSELKLDDRPYRTLLVLLAGIAPMAVDGDWLKTIVELPGFPVLFQRNQKLPDTVAKTTQQLASVEEKAAPAGTYDPPAGYTAVDAVAFLRASSAPTVP
jgi:hypothetical protein